MKYAKALHGKTAWEDSDLERGFKEVPMPEVPEEDVWGVSRDITNNDMRVGNYGPMKRGEGVK